MPDVSEALHHKPIPPKVLLRRLRHGRPSADHEEVVEPDRHSKNTGRAKSGQPDRVSQMASRAAMKRRAREIARRRKRWMGKLAADLFGI